MERDVGVIVVERGVDLRTGEKLAADLAVFHARDGGDVALGGMTGTASWLSMASRNGLAS